MVLSSRPLTHGRFLPANFFCSRFLFANLLFHHNDPRGPLRDVGEYFSAMKLSFLPPQGFPPEWFRPSPKAHGNPSIMDAPSGRGSTFRPPWVSQVPLSDSVPLRATRPSQGEVFRRLLFFFVCFFSDPPFSPAPSPLKPSSRWFTESRDLLRAVSF